MSWPLTSLLVVALVLVAGFAWYERSRPPAKVLTLVAALAALATIGRIAFAAFPNVKPTTDIALFAGYALGPEPGFAVGAVAALVSNFFFGQGPWTPWQMVAWGLTGAGGGVLARILGRELGRLPLALACAVAGFAFGAIMDASLMLQSGSPSAARFAAISGTSLPFNVAHAAGNVAFCLLVGPSFVRMLARYRLRLDVRWVAVASSLALACALALPASSLASPLSAGVGYLRAAQNGDGGFGPAPGHSSAQLETGWAILGLRGAGVDPGSVRRGGSSPLDYAVGHAGAVSDLGSVERTALALEASGLSPRSFAGRDLIAQTLGARASSGAFGGTINLTAFGVLACAPAGVPGLGGSAGWLEHHQNGDGGFGFAPGAPSDVDDTGAVLEALTATGLRGDGAEGRATAFLRGVQNGDGGFGEQPGESSNTQSTAWAVQGLVAAGAEPDSVSRALAYIASLQRSDGSIRYSRTSAQTPVWVTAQALDALARAPFPLGFTPPSGATGQGGGQSASASAARARAAQRRKRAARRAGLAAAPGVSGTGALVPGRAASARRGGAGPWFIGWIALGLIAAFGTWRLVQHRRRLRPAPPQVSPPGERLRSLP